MSLRALPRGIVGTRICPRWPLHLVVKARNSWANSVGELLGTLQNYAVVPQSHLSVEAYSVKAISQGFLNVGSNQLNSFIP